MLRACTAIFLCSGALSAQAILEHSLAAGVGSTAGAAMGKGVSDVLSRTSIATAEAASKGAPPPGRKAAPVVAGKAGTSNEPEIIRGARRTGAPTAVKLPVWAVPVGPVAFPQAPAAPQAPTDSTTPTVSEEAVVPPAPAPQASREGLLALQKGDTRSSVLSQLGAPASRISMSGDGGLVEVYQFRANGAAVGSIRFQDGSVASVQVAP